MADIELVIKIPEDLYKATINGLNAKEIWDLRVAIKNGTSLTKGHGRILDEKDILNVKNNGGGWYDLVDMPEYIAGVKAIMEADKTESEVEE